MGTGYLSNTCFHLGEYRVSNPPTRKFMIVRENEGKKVLEEYTDITSNSDLFGAIGTGFEQACSVRQSKIGESQCRLFSLRDAVDLPRSGWMTDREFINRALNCVPHTSS